MKEEILELLKINEKYKGLEDTVASNLCLCIAKSGDSALFSEIPQSMRRKVIEHGLSVKENWYEISNNGMADYSEYAPILNELTKEYLGNVPLGEYIHFGDAKNT